MVGVEDGRSDGIESSKTHILSEPEGGSSCDADCLGGPPLSSVQHSLKASHEEVAPKVHIEILEVNVFLLQVLLVTGMSTYFIHCSGKHIRNSSSSSISRIFAQELSFQVSLLFLQLGSALIGQVVGVTHEPRTGTVVFGVGCAFLGASSLSSSTSIPCCLSSTISSASTPRILGATS